MAKTKWAEVQDAADARRQWGAATDHNRCPRGHGALLNIFTIADDPLIGTIIGKFGSQSTLALGLVYSTEGLNLVVARKSVSQELEADIEVLRKKHLPQGNLLTTDPIVAGLHAEMAIVRYCLQTLQIQQQDLGNFLQVVCVGKLVCKDCAGWMNSHFIGHCSVSGEPPRIEFACGGVSTMGGGVWQSPRTGAVYSGGNDLNHYSKNGKTLSKPLGT